MSYVASKWCLATTKLMSYGSNCRTERVVAVFGGSVRHHISCCRPESRQRQRQEFSGTSSDLIRPHQTVAKWLSESMQQCISASVQHCITTELNQCFTTGSYLYERWQSRAPYAINDSYLERSDSLTHSIVSTPLIALVLGLRDHHMCHQCLIVW